MGYMTVALILNDAMHDLAKSPKTLAAALTYPRSRGTSLEEHLSGAVVTGKSEGEDPSSFFSGGIQVLPTFHADESQFLLAGGNTIVPMTFVKYGHTKDGQLTVSLVVPDWLNPKAATRERAKAKRAANKARKAPKRAIRKAKSK